MKTAVADCTGQEAGRRTTGSEPRRPFFASAVAAATSFPSLVVSAAASTDVVHSRLIEWAAPAPGWLLAVSSAAFFLLALFAFSQYRKRVTCTLSSGEDESGVGSSSSGPAVTSLPNPSGGRVPDFLFPALASRTAKTYVNAATRLPRSHSVGVYRRCCKVFSPSCFPQPLTRGARSTRTAYVSADAALAGCNAVQSAARSSATAAASPLSPCVTEDVSPQRIDKNDAPAANVADMCSQVKDVTVAPACYADVSLAASRDAGTAGATLNIFEQSGELAPLMPATSSSFLCSQATPPLGVTIAVLGTTAGRFLPPWSGASVECRSIKGCRVLGEDSRPIGQTVNPPSSKDSSKRGSPGSQNRTAALARLTPVTFSTSSPFDETDADEDSDGAVPECNGSTPRKCPASPACMRLTLCTSAPSREVAAVQDAGTLCHSPASVFSSFSLDSLRDVPTSAPPLVLRQEIMLHGAVPSKERWRFSGRSTSSLISRPKKSKDVDVTCAPLQKRSREVNVTATREGNGRGAEAARSTTAAGPRHIAAARDGREASSVESGSTPEVIEEMGYASLAVDEEDVSAVSCGGARTTFAFDGASMRSVILAIVTAAALLRALLLLLQLVANPLEGKRATPAVTGLPTRSSSLPRSPGIVRHATSTADEEWSQVNHVTGIPVLSSAYTNLSIDGYRRVFNVSSTGSAPQLPTATGSNSSLIPPAESVTMLPIATAAYPLGLLGNSDKTGTVASTGVSEASYDSTSTTQSHHVHVSPSLAHHVHLPPSSLPPSFTPGSSPLPDLPAGSTAAGKTGSATPKRLFPGSTTTPITSLLLPGERPSTLSLESSIHAPSLQTSPPPYPTFVSVIKRRLKAGTEVRAVSATTSARTTEDTPLLSFTAPANKITHPRVSLPPNMLHSSIVALNPVAGHTTTMVPASAAAHTTSEPHGQTDKENHGLVPVKNTFSVMVERKKEYFGALEKGQDVGASGSSSTTHNGPQVVRSPPVSSNTTENGNVLPRFKSSVYSEDKIFSDGSLKFRDRSTPNEVTFQKWASSTRGGRRRKTAEKRKQPRGSSTGNKSGRRTVRAKPNRNTSNTPATGSRTGTAAKGRRTGWPSALWLRTLARSLPPMLCVKVYALLVLFLLDLYYASSRLENVRWVAVGSYIFLAGIWLLFVSVAGLTVAEDNTRREAAHLFARSICWLLGFCFTLLSVSLAIVGSLVLKQLRGRKSTQLFFRPPMVVEQPMDSSDSSLHAVAASSVYRPPQPCLPSTHPFMETGAPAYPPSAASVGEYCVTHRDGEDQPIGAVAPLSGRNKPWLPTFFTKYWTAIPEAATTASAFPEGGRATYSYDDLAAPLPPQHDFENQERGGLHGVRRVSDLAWIERRRQQLTDQEGCSRIPQATQEATNHREARNALLWLVNWRFLSFFKKSMNTSPSGLSALPFHNTARRRLLMLTLCCPPLLMVRGVHLLLVGAQIFSHYYPSFVEEKGTFDVFVYLITEWLPLTLLVCASSHTSTSKQRGNSLGAHATYRDDAHDTHFHLAQSPVLPLPPSPSNRCNYCRRDGGLTPLWPHRSKASSGFGTACIHQRHCLLSPRSRDAHIYTSHVQPQHEQQFTAQERQRQAEEGLAYKVREKHLSDVRKERGLWNMALRVGDLASQNFFELPFGQPQPEKKTWKQLFSRSGKGSSVPPREPNRESRNSDTQFGVPLLTDDVFTGPQALRFARQQHCTTSSSNTSRRDSDGR